MSRCLRCDIAINEHDLYCNECRPESFQEKVIEVKIGSLNSIFQFVLFSVSSFIGSLFFGAMIVTLFFTNFTVFTQTILVFFIVLMFMNFYFVKGAKLKTIPLIICNIPFLIILINITWFMPTY